MATSIDTNPNLIYSGSIPNHYEEFLGPMFFEPYAIEVATRIDPSEIRTALELASGTGRVTRHLRNLLPSTAKLVASDISPDMLNVAREKLAGLDIDWRIIDAGSLPFEENSIDLVVCCFGFMFVDDKSKAFAEVHRVLKPGGMLIFTTWNALEFNGASLIYREIARRFLEPPLPDSFYTPLSMCDEKEIASLLDKTHFSNIKIETVEKMAYSESAKKAAEGLSQGGAIYKEVMKRNPAWVEEIKILLEKELVQQFGEAPMVAPMSAVVTQAWK